MTPEWELVKDLGGWGAFLLVVIWLVRQQAKHAERLIHSFERAVESFQNFEDEERVLHSTIMETQRAILEAIKDLRREISK